MAHLASAFFFLTLIGCAVAGLALLLREHELEIVAALRGERPLRRGHRRWNGARVRSQVRSGAYRPTAPSPLRAAF